MDIFLNKYFKKYWLMLVVLGAFLLVNISLAQAQTATLYTDLTSWEAMVCDIEVFSTTSSNIEKAGELTTTLGKNDSTIGHILTFQTANTSLSRGFTVETLQVDDSMRVPFTFDDEEDTGNIPSFDNALSVGNIDNWEDDDWRLSLLDGASMTAFAVEVRHARFAPGESITLYSNNVLMDTISLSSLPSTGNADFFIGITTDFTFDRIDFNEDPDGDDIAIADFRFATVVGNVQIISPSNYSVACLNVGDEYYLDRSYNLTSIPAELDTGSEEWIMTDNDDKYMTSSSFLEFTISQDSTVYVAYDSRATSLPDWLENGFAPTSRAIVVTDHKMGHFDVYQGNYSAGTVTLGGNKATGAANARSNYIVIVLPTGPQGDDLTSALCRLYVLTGNTPPNFCPQ